MFKSLSRRFRPVLTRLEDRTAPAAGMLDPTFGVGGRVATPSPFGGHIYCEAVTVDQLGRTLAAGTSGNSSNKMVIARYLSNGSLDRMFGGTGFVTVDFTPSGSTTNWRSLAYGIAVDANGCIIVAGTTSESPLQQTYIYDFAVARLLDSGSLDPTFSGDGKQTFDFGAADVAIDVAIDSQGRIVLGGTKSNSENSAIGLACVRLMSNGELDDSFGAGGKQLVEVPYVSGGAMCVDSLDRVLIAGSTKINFTQPSDYFVARLTSAGFLDSSFDSDGRLTIDFNGGSDGASAVTTDSQDRVVVAGGANNGTNSDFGLARLTTAGGFDTSFGSGGKTIVDFGESDGASGVEIDSHGNIVVGGNTRVTMQSNRDLAVARLTPDGVLDTSFDNDGKQVIDVGTTFPFSSSIAIASGDRVVIGGGTVVTQAAAFSLARLTGDTTTAAAQVNDGSAQRSRVTSLTVRFSGQVTFAGKPVQAFTLLRTGGGAVTFSANVSVEYGGTVVTLSNFAGPETEFGSLRDGRYTLTALASQISAGWQPIDGDADGTPGGNFVFGDAQGLFRFFGDINGDRRVDIADFGLFSVSYLNAANYVAGFDFNGDGRIDIADFGQFAIRYLTLLP